MARCRRCPGPAPPRHRPGRRSSPGRRRSRWVKGAGPWRPWRGRRARHCPPARRRRCRRLPCRPCLPAASSPASCSRSGAPRPCRFLPGPGPRPGPASGQRRRAAGPAPCGTHRAAPPRASLRGPASPAVCRWPSGSRAAPLPRHPGAADPSPPPPSCRRCPPPRPRTARRAAAGLRRRTRLPAAPAPAAAGRWASPPPGRGPRARSADSRASDRARRSAASWPGRGAGAD